MINAANFNPHVIIARGRTGGHVMMRPDRRSQGINPVSKGQVLSELMPTHRFIDLRVGSKDYLLLCEGNDKQEKFFGPFRGQQEFGFSFLIYGKHGTTPVGQIVRSVEAFWEVLSSDEYAEMGMRLNNPAMANTMEFREPLLTVGTELLNLEGSRQELMASGYPFAAAPETIERLAGPLREEFLFAGQEWERLLESKYDHDNHLTPSILDAIEIYFADKLREQDAIILDPMLGTGGYLREVGERYPCKIVVGDTNCKILSVFDLEGAEKQLSDAVEIMDRLGERKKKVKLVVLRGCNFLVVSHEKAKIIFRNIYENLEKGSGIIVTGATRVLFDSDFINLLPGAKILQRITWNTNGVLLPFYVVVKG